jgi:hypothetical protein
MNIREYYRQDCKENIYHMDRCNCKPFLNTDKYKKECSFVDKKLVIDKETKHKLLKDNGFEIKYDNIDVNVKEVKDYIEQFPLFILEKDTILCHSSKITHMLSKNSDGEIVYNKEKWWEKYYPGHSNYKGGWFTYETNYGGPRFGILIKYKIKKDIPILFVPNYLTKIDNPDYFPELITNSYNDGTFSGSHIVEGVKGWKNKNYEKIEPKYFADQFAEKIVSLGFDGYISCDECEVFLTHKIMPDVLERPFEVEFEFNDDETFLCPNCMQELLKEENECLSCGEKNINPADSNKYFKKVFDYVINNLCVQEQCEIKIKPGNRNISVLLEGKTKI